MSIKIKTFLWITFWVLITTSCSWIKMKQNDSENKVVARVENVYLYESELVGLIPKGTTSEDSSMLIKSYVESWVRKQLVINRALKVMDIDEKEVQRKLLDYRYSLIGFEYQNYYVQNHLNTEVSDKEVEEYYQAHPDNFTLRQNIIRGAFIKVPLGAPNRQQLKSLLRNSTAENEERLKAYCIQYSEAYHLDEDQWMVFDELVVGSPLSNIPDKVQFLTRQKFYEVADERYTYLLKINEYRISNSAAPKEFAEEEIKSIILNKRKVELVKQLEEEIYANAANDNNVEIFY